MTVKELRLYLAYFDEDDEVSVSDSVFDFSRQIYDCVLFRSFKNDKKNCVLIPFSKSSIDSSKSSRSIFSLSEDSINEAD